MNIQIKLTREENLAHFHVQKGAVITLDLEKEYLPVCVASEIYEAESRTPMEAKKAQAIAARTYVTALLLSGTVIDDTTNYQAFKWKELASIPNCARAVQETAGQVLLCDGKLITAWYSNSNGGRTRRSDETWSAYNPWTVSQDDPWDAAGREKWGQCPASHGVGMSQIGAAWAAFVGRTCREILAFYYPNTRIVGEYGKGDTMDEKPNLGLVAWAQALLGQPYWYGTFCQLCTQSLLTAKKEQYPTHYTDSRMARYRDDIAKGRYCCDCIGLIKGYLWTQDNKVAYDADTDMNTGGLYNKATMKGMIQALPEVPGLIVYKEGHVGVYIGGGVVIEAKGFNYGVVRSKLSDTPWTHWIAYPGISYAGYEEMLAPEAFTGPYDALVVTQTSPLNLWDSPKKGTSLKQVPKGATVRVTEYGGQIGWLKAEHAGVTGFADRQYLRRIDEIQAPELPDDLGDAEDAEQWYPYRAKVVNVKTSLNLRRTPEKIEGNTVLFIPLGEMVDVLEDNCGNGFLRVRYGTVEGYCTRSYLMQLEG